MGLNKAQGEYYDNTSSWQEARWQDLMRLIPEDWTESTAPFKKALDLGCGSGKRTVKLLDKFPALEQVTGIDADQGMLATALAIDQHTTAEYADEYFDHWLTASAGRCLYGHEGKELSEKAYEDIYTQLFHKYRHELSNKLQFEEDTVMFIARRKA